MSSRYGIDSIVFWSRLQPLIAKEYMTVVESTKVRMDMLTALTLLSFLYSIIWLLLVAHLDLPRTVLAWTCAPGVLAALLFYGGAVEAARSFGETVRSSFDLYRHKLLEQFGFTVPASLEEEKELWLRINRFVFYKDPVGLPFAPKGPDSAAAKPAVQSKPKASFLSSVCRLLGLDWCAAARPEIQAHSGEQKRAPQIEIPPPRKVRARPLRACFNLLAILALVTVLVWHARMLHDSGDRHLVLAPAATRTLPAGAVVTREDLQYRIGRSSAPGTLIADPRDIEGRPLLSPVNAGAFFSGTALQEVRALKIVRLVVAAVSPLAAGDRVDLWRPLLSTGQLDQMVPVLIGVEVVGAQGVSAVPPASASARKGSLLAAEPQPASFHAVDRM